MDFIALDLETADKANSAPCSIGLVEVKDNQIVDRKYYLINPETEFHFYAIRVHKITPDMVADAPTLPEIWPELFDRLNGQNVVAHNINYDIGVLAKAAERYSLTFPSVTQYCTMQAAKDNPFLDGSSLSAVCAQLGIKLSDHHNALADAEACAKIAIMLLNGVDPVEDPTGEPSADQTALISLYDMIRRPLEKALGSYWITPDKLLFIQRKSYDSICLINESRLILRLYSQGGRSFIALPPRDRKYIIPGVAYERRADGFLKIEVPGDVLPSELSALLETVADQEVLSFPSTFGCCALYEECSDPRRCLRADANDDIYLGCYYRKNLRNGKVFYGKAAEDPGSGKN